jgi:hypothetical protein
MVDAAFGHWFAGFVDGEGCFEIARNGDKGFRVRFKIGLRDDDAEILRVSQAAVGGHLEVRSHHKRRAEGHQHEDELRLVLSGRKACKPLVELFRAYPLRSKKARDFEIWADAVESDVALKDLGPWRERLDAARAYRKVGAA